MAKKLNDDDLLRITGNEIRQSIGYRTGRLSEARRKNLQYYLQRPVLDLAPPEIEGRSSYVDSSVHDVIEWMMPSLIKTFTAGDSVVEFAATKPEHEESAKLVTDYVNYVWQRQNPGFQILSTWFKDALLSKAGILKVMWQEDSTETREEYNDQSAEELQILSDDDEVEIIESTAKPDEEDAEDRQKALEQLQQQLSHAQQAATQNPQAAQAAQQIQAQIDQINAQPKKQVYDVAFKRTKKTAQVRIFNVPPEEFLVNRDATSIAGARFCAHQVLRTISDLKAEGYKNTEDLTSDDVQASLSVERIERITYNDETGWQSGANEVPSDPSQRQIWITECYLKADRDGDGIAEWLKVTRAGNQVLECEECDGPPFVLITPVPLPHQLFGLCPADQAVEIQKHKTSVTRAAIDNLQLSVNARMFAVDGQVNLDDLLTSRPGGIVRIKQQGAVGRLDQGQGDQQGAYQLLDYLELQKEQRTGQTRQTQGVNEDAMNQTATGATIRTAKEDSRIELIARQFAETGVKDLFKLILKLVCQHQNKEAQIHVSGKWVAIDPRAWRNQYDLVINVGLGSGNKDQEVSHLMALIQTQMQSLPLQIVTPQNLFASHSKLQQALGFKQDGLFFSDPTNPETAKKMPPPPPNPEQAKTQAAVQMKQLDHQADAQKFQAQMQADTQRFQLEQQARKSELEQQLQVKMHELDTQFKLQASNDERDAQRAQLEAQYKAQIEQMKVESDERQSQLKADIDKYRADLDSQTRLTIAGMAAPTPIDLSGIEQSIGMLMEHMSAPVSIVRDPAGRAVGIQKGAMNKSIQRGPDGRATGVQ